MSGIVVNIPKEKFLPCYHHLLDDREFFDIDFLYGGRDSGKSRHIAQQLIFDCLRQSYFKCLLIREVLNTVRDSQYSLIKSVVEEWNLKALFSFNDTRLEIKCINGNGFFGRGLDDVGRIKSFSNPSHCWIEEGNQITHEDFVVILTSLRANQRVKTWFSFNPECEVTYTDFWLWQEWFSHTDKLSWTWTNTIEVDGEQVEFKARATHTTYKDNPYCKPQRKALYESYKNSKNNAYWYQTYTLGLWGYRRTGGEFWKCFDESLHTADVKPDLNSVIYVIADNNVNPYIAIAIWQINVREKRIVQIDELPCEHPNNTASKAGKQVVKYLDSISYKQPVYIGGDPSANAKSTVDDEGRSFFDKFKAAIREGGYQIVDKVGRSAPAVAQSGAFINEIYESNYGGWSIVISKNCRKSIEDYNMAKEAADGTILKKRETDKETKVSFERYGHYCVIGSTLIATDKGEKQIKDIEIGDYVLTRNGFKKVLNKWLTIKNALVNRYKISGNEIVCTPNHKVFANDNFFEAFSLTIKDTFCIFDKAKNRICKKKQSSSTVLNSIVTLIRNLNLTAIILRAGLLNSGKERKNTCTDINGKKSIVNLFLRVIMFITLTLTSIIIQTVTWVLLLTLYILGITTIYKAIAKRRQRLVCCLIKLFRHLKGGIVAKRGKSGTLSTVKEIQDIEPLSSISANHAESNLNQRQYIPQDTAQMCANRQAEEKKEKTTNSAFVQFVQLNIRAINTLNLQLVHGSVPHSLENNADVYDIEVDGEHEYFANGILIHNSDDKRYFITTVLPDLFNQYKSRSNRRPISVSR